ncbi:hypothetical protein C475_03259 [Halosimplex carlsbadense 2-9-1]|uniref:Uncharacterized protein n=1 Tax=Halosimplex carlsbadense 2-9-1 TaxID=797114 RepID=M0D3C7_9EURY|nr:DUF5787 family protein [Halosimplex carlsbadense]ELZ29202.1 hypothetical protein C475_03259 [Halosimplex carlsbadense 2-9-1]
MQEFAFELALCARLEEPERVVGRQLGAAVHGRRVADVCLVEPGPEFEDRAAITAETIPPLAIESAVGPGTARSVTDAFDCHPDRARAIAERAVELGYFERERAGSSTAVRATVRYPDDWFDSLVGIENKPDLDRPGDLRDQLRIDASLGVFDEVILATETYVTGAHLNRLPDAVGVWRFDPETGEREVVREPEPLDTDGPGIELLDREPGRAEVRPVTADEKRRQRRRIAERAYGKGWRTYEPPDCERCVPGDAEPVAFADAGLPWCAWGDEIVRPVADCGPTCPGYEPVDGDADTDEDGEPPVADSDAVRARRSAWEPDPAGVDRRQAGLDRFL